MCTRWRNLITFILILTYFSETIDYLSDYQSNVFKKYSVELILKYLLLYIPQMLGM